MTASWEVEAIAGPVASLLSLPGAEGRTARILTPEDRALVLGSTQPEGHVDSAAAAATETAVFRRDSGGGAVLVGPGLTLWADVTVPVGDRLWCADVGQAFWWLGDVWAAALADAGLPGAEVWRGPLLRGRWSDRVCFAGLGPGEVRVAGAKVVGMAQRRTRSGSRFHCAVTIVWRPEDLVALLALDAGERVRAAVELAPVAAGVGADVARRLVPAFFDRLPGP
ncbi:MAG TPA: hypothetical protein VHT75_03390 [Acidimicrobiales bacterium]|nr:hypothetical protein [Acidimicrobiales bacterium]